MVRRVSVRMKRFLGPKQPFAAQQQFGRSELVLCFPYRSAKIEPVPAISFLTGNGGGWIALGLVVMDRF